MENQICSPPSDKSDITARKWLRLEMPPMRGFSPARNGISEGIAITVRMNLVHSHGETPGVSQPASRVRNMHGADRVRRRLSIIFQRLIAGMRTFRCLSALTPADVPPEVPPDPRPNPPPNPRTQ